jgi:hypothetical protein
MLLFYFYSCHADKYIHKRLAICTYIHIYHVPYIYIYVLYIYRNVYILIKFSIMMFFCYAYYRKGGKVYV